MTEEKLTEKEKKRLLSEYAAGLLSREDRQVLMTAALEDQELFTEVTRNQPLADVMASPSSRAELRTALENQGKGGFWAWILRPWPVGVAATAMTALIVAMMVHYLEPTSVSEIYSPREKGEAVETMAESQSVVPSAAKENAAPVVQDSIETKAKKTEASPTEFSKRTTGFQQKRLRTEVRNAETSPAKMEQSPVGMQAEEQRMGPAKQKSETKDRKAEAGEGKAEEWNAERVLVREEPEAEGRKKEGQKTERLRADVAVRMPAPPAAGAVSVSTLERDEKPVDKQVTGKADDRHAVQARKSAAAPGREVRAAPVIQRIQLDANHFQPTAKDGFSYRLFRRDAQGRFLSVPPGTIFTAGDVIRIVFDIQTTGFLTVVEEKENNIWGVLYPDSGTDRRQLVAGSTFVLTEDKVGKMAESGRQRRLRVILTSTPDPMVIDPNGALKIPEEAVSMEILLSGSPEKK